MKCEDCKEQTANYHLCFDCKWKIRKTHNWLIFGWTLFFGIFLFTMILFLSGVFDTGIDKMNFDENKIASDYVKSYYPEFKDCIIEYDYCIDQGDGFFIGCAEGVEIHCTEIDSRDAMRSLKGEPTKTLIFEKGLTLDKIIEARLVNEGLK